MCVSVCVLFLFGVCWSCLCLFLCIALCVFAVVCFSTSVYIYMYMLYLVVRVFVCFGVLFSWGRFFNGMFVIVSVVFVFCVLCCSVCV